MIITVAAFELILALLIASKKVSARTGLMLAAVFILFLIPYWWAGGAIINTVFDVTLLWLAKFDYPVSLSQHFIRVTTE